MKCRLLPLTALLTLAVLVQPALGQVPGETYTDEPTMPGGIEGQRVQLLLDAINAGDVELARAFYEQHLDDGLRATFPAEEFLEWFPSFVREQGGLDFHGVRTYDPPRQNQTIVITKNRNYGAWTAIVFRYEGDKEGPLAGLRFAHARTPSDVVDPPLTEQEAVAEAEALLDRLCEKDLFSGTVLIARGDEVLLTRACGEASKRFHAPVDMDTKFNIGSMNKMFTAVAVAQLAEKGLVSYDDPIGKYLDESWLPASITERVTVHHLLTHTSGLGSFFNETFDQGARKRFREIDSYKELISGDTLAFEPGTEWQYSNSGMFLAGVIVEKITGESYYDYIRENVYAPAGMENSDCYEMDCPVENLAIGYYRSPGCAGGWRNNLFEHTIKGGPAGGGFSTAPDLHRFARALQTGVLVPDTSLETLWTDHYGHGYGYGFGIREESGGTVVGHGGGFTGINANLDMFVDSGYIVVVMSNYDNAGAPVDMRLADFISRIPLVD